MPPPTPLRPLYTPAQLAAYFTHIRLPPSLHTQRPSLAHLRRLQRHQLATVPWENLSKHYSLYSTPVTAVLGAQDLFAKIVGSGHGRDDGARGGRGGGCLENNAFFGTVLRSLGYECYPGGGRVNMGGGVYTGWEHMVNFVTLDGQKYMCDVGFGARGQSAPLAVTEDEVVTQIAPASARLTKAALAAHTDPAQRLWVYQVRDGDAAQPWEDVYCFAETEFLPQDFEAMTVGTTYRRNSFFAYSIAMCRMVMAGEVGVTDVEGDEIVGVITLTDRECKRRVRGRTEVLKVFETEGERLEALRRWFGIEFGEAERRGVRGTAVGLPD
ncbi:N-terminal acetyltransferase [Xylographa bjoerkii]|nr:N-terminal acetyltransferase [Xylographa bjoerkii]